MGKDTGQSAQNTEQASFEEACKDLVNVFVKRPFRIVTRPPRDSSVTMG
jgi:hypothetical protein